MRTFSASSTHIYVTWRRESREAIRTLRTGWGGGLKAFLARIFTIDILIRIALTLIRELIFVDFTVLGDCLRFSTSKKKEVIVESVENR